MLRLFGIAGLAVLSALGLTGCPLDTPVESVCSWTAPGGDRSVDPQNGGTYITGTNKGHWPLNPPNEVAAQCWGYNIYYGCLFWAAAYDDLEYLYGPAPTQGPCL